MSNTLRLGIAGLGTVGSEVARLIQVEAPLHEKRSGKKLVVTAVSARDKNKKRDNGLSSLPWADNPSELAARSDVDAVVELMGGAEGAAKQLAEATLKAGKPLITANKALLAHHGLALSELARKQSAPLYFEAAVAGGIPIIKTLREALAGGQVDEIFGILNGTCNFILTTMRDTGRSFGDVLKEAQSLGYAEADPAFDIDGKDAAHKLSILSALGFGAPLEPEKLIAEGVRGITSQDILFADELGYRIKLLGVARQEKDGLFQRVSPYMVSTSSTLAHVNGAMNAIMIRGPVIGPLVLMGHGAGAGPTASAVLSDIIDCASGRQADGFASVMNPKATPLSAEKSKSAFYLRMMVQDQPGVLADITAIMRDAKISIQSVIQHGRSEAGPVPIVFITHDTSEKAFSEAFAAVKKLSSVLEPPCVIRILP
jgi:homoserine dehydrogenase